MIMYLIVALTIVTVSLGWVVWFKDNKWTRLAYLTSNTFLKGAGAYFVFAALGDMEMLAGWIVQLLNLMVKSGVAI